MRGKFDFDHRFAFLTNFLKRQNFLPRLVERIIFKKIVQNGPSLQILSNWGQKYFIYFWQKQLSFVVCCECDFVRFWLTFLIELLIELRKMLLRNKLFDVRFGNCSTPKVTRFCRFTGFIKMQLT